jgi:hypothetical protein
LSRIASINRKSSDSVGREEEKRCRPTAAFPFGIGRDQLQVIFIAHQWLFTQKTRPEKRARREQAFVSGLKIDDNNCRTNK